MGPFLSLSLFDEVIVVQVQFASRPKNNNFGKISLALTEKLNYAGSKGSTAGDPGQQAGRLEARAAVVWKRAPDDPEPREYTGLFSCTLIQLGHIYITITIFFWQVFQKIVFFLPKKFQNFATSPCQIAFGCYWWSSESDQPTRVDCNTCVGNG